MVHIDVIISKIQYILLTWATVVMVTEKNDKKNDKSKPYIEVIAGYVSYEIEKKLN